MILGTIDSQVHPTIEWLGLAETVLINGIYIGSYRSSLAENVCLWMNAIINMNQG
jgi:hypothetical protein